MRRALTSLPKSVTPEILRACDAFGLSTAPVFVPITPESGSRPNKCILNVRDAAAAGTYQVATGWKILAWPGVLVEFLGHAVARLPSGAFLCITPDIDGDKCILFAPDDRILFDESDPLARMPTKRVPLTHHQDVVDFIRIEEQIAAIKLKFPPSSGTIRVEGVDAVRLQRLYIAERGCIRDIFLRTWSPARPCPCGRGRPFRACCRLGMVREQMAERTG